MKSPAEARPQPLRTLLAPIIAENRARLTGLAFIALVGGLTEASVLVLVARVGVAITANEASITFDLGPLGSVDAGIPTLLGIAGALVALKFGLQVLWARMFALLSASELARVRKSLFRLFLEASWALQSQEREGRLQEFMTTYAANAAAVLGMIIQGVTALCTLMALMIVAIAVNAPASIAVVAAIVFLLAALKPFRSGVRRRSTVSAAAQLNFATALTESTLMAQEIRIFNVERMMRDRMEASIDAHGRAYFRTRFLGGILPSIYQSAALAFIIIMLAVTYSVEPADVGSIGAVLLLLVRSLSQGQLLQGVYQNLHENAPYVERLNADAKAFGAAAVEREGEAVGRIGAIAFDHVSFEYEPGVAVLRNVSFRATRGELIGIVGPSGSGKSTLVQILLRLRQPQSGTVLADDLPVDRLALDDWYDRVTFVPQEPRLFSGTVAENIRFLRPDIDDEAVERAARAANLHEDVMGWPRGYDTPVGERGGQLSGGQRQRLCIARALVGDPDVIVLDEPTSALDSRSEALVRETLANLRSRAMLFVIAHRLSTLDLCDRIMVLVNGEVQGFDRPAQLELDSSFYREALRLSGIR
jgi:ABC-type multidrug transport system fused ATPase/permease subunit